MGEAAIDLPDNYFDKPKSEYLQRRDVLVKRLNSMPGVFCPNPGGAFYAIARLPIDDCDVFCQWLLESFSHNKQTVMLAPASGFYGTAGLGKNEVRLAYVLNVGPSMRPWTAWSKPCLVIPAGQNNTIIL